MTRRKHRLPMSAPMIRAIEREIEAPGTGKAQTRRMVRPQPVKERRFWIFPWGAGCSRDRLPVMPGHATAAASPYGRPGDLLAFTEAWKTLSLFDDCPPREIDQRARIVYLADGKDTSGRYRQARFMPYWASRYTGVVTDVRVERVQEISEEDAKAEGVTGDEPIHGPGAPAESASDFLTARWAFANLWNSIHGPDAWDRNDWVYAYTFRPIAANVLHVEHDPAAYGVGEAA